MISVIIPVYNVEKYLERCLNSVINQTYKDIEIIVVNDGSTDLSGQICEKYGQADKRIHVINKKNMGLSAARNTGIEYAKGEYLVFVDSDDFIDLRMIEIMHKELLQNQADLAICDYKVVTDIYKENEEKKIAKSKVIGFENFPDFVTRNYKKAVVAWNKLYPRKLFCTMRYPVGKYYEDEYILYELLHMCKKIVYVKRQLYFYYQRNDSISHSYTEKNISDKMQAYKYQLEYCRLCNWYSMESTVSQHYLHTLINCYKNLKINGESQDNYKIYYQDFKNTYHVNKKRYRLSFEEKVAFTLFMVSPELFFLILKTYRKMRSEEK